jgi:hypothetical protein
MDLRRGLIMQMIGGADMGAGIFEKLEVCSLTVSGLTTSSDNLSNKSFTVNHNLGVVPDFVFLYPKQRKIPALQSGGTTIRVLQYASYFDIGSNYVSNDTKYIPTMDCVVRLYTTSADRYYEQYDNYNGSSIINTLTSQSVTIGGVNINNTGLFNGDYWVMIGKIASQYEQGGQVI